MLTYLEELRRWVDEHQSASDSTVALRFREGRSDVPKRSADVGLESIAALGVAAIWESGEFEAEVVDIATMKRTLVISAIVEDTTDLRQRLDQVLEAVQG